MWRWRFQLCNSSKNPIPFTREVCESATWLATDAMQFPWTIKRHLKEYLLCETDSNIHRLDIIIILLTMILCINKRFYYISARKNADVGYSWLYTAVIQFIHPYNIFTVNGYVYCWIWTNSSSLENHQS